MKKIVSIGEVLMDVYSADGIDKAEVGGASFNVACSIAALGTNESYFMGSLGNDDHKETINSFLKKFDVKTNFIQDSNLQTTIARVTLDENKERFFEFIRNSDAEFNLDLIEDVSLKEIDFIHFGSATGFLPGNLNKSYWDLFRFAQENNIRFSFDPNFRDKLWLTSEDINNFCKFTNEFLLKADLIKLSDEELQLLTGIKDEEKALKKLMENNKKALICITRGSKDTMCGWNNEILYVPTIKCEELVDTTGAGDAFVSSLINEFVSENIDSDSSKEKIFEIVMKSNKFANQTVRHLGALTFLDYLEK
ncbi:carbohydrate kinase family protein [Spiroplasma apis]|uniref:Fructokinase n=1 Tax=Spiroplasma apis B31 TaxID=1276258 RepID=V5RIF1_SPIAP|nr:carbohydrate kinase [Spiroplasma apis]AHB36334.1 fructokinase [Spiroplasma apis B31]